MSSAPSPLSYVYDGRECLGFILARGKLTPGGRLSDVINVVLLDRQDDRDGNRADDDFGSAPARKAAAPKRDDIDDEIPF